MSKKKVLLDNINVNLPRALRNMVQFLHHPNPQQSSLKLRSHTVVLHFNRESEQSSERANASLAQNNIDRPLVLPILECRNVFLSANPRHQRKKLSITVWNVLGPCGRAADSQVARGSPLAMDVSWVFDAGAFEFDEVVGDGVADVNVGVIGMVLLVWLFAGQELEVGHVLVFACMRVVGEHGLAFIAEQRDGHVGHLFEVWTHRLGMRWNGNVRM